MIDDKYEMPDDTTSETPADNTDTGGANDLAGDAGVDLNADGIMPENPANYNLETASAGERAEAENFMAEHPELFTDEVDNTFTEVETHSNLHNPDAENMTIGPYKPGEDGVPNPDSYEQVAQEAGNAYFDNPDYNTIQQEGNYTNQEMYVEGGNEPAMEEASDRGMGLQVTEDPREATGTTERELDTWHELHGTTNDDFEYNGETGTYDSPPGPAQSSDYNETPPEFEPADDSVDPPTDTGGDEPEPSYNPEDDWIDQVDAERETQAQVEAEPAPVETTSTESASDGI